MSPGHTHACRARVRVGLESECRLRMSPGHARACRARVRVRVGVQAQDEPWTHTCMQGEG